MNSDAQQQPQRPAFERHDPKAELRATVQPSFHMHDARHGSADAAAVREAFVTRSLHVFRRAVLLDVAAGIAYVLLLALLGLTARPSTETEGLTAGFVAQGVVLQKPAWEPHAFTITSVLLTVLVVLVTVNAVNFVDGLDGLAAGIVGIGAMAFFAYAYLLSVDYGFSRATLAALVMAVLAGMCLGLLPHNVFPARIFMGDTGSMLIGLLLASGVITLTGQVDPSALPTATIIPTLLPILLPIAVVAVPLLDLLLAVVRRTRARRSPFAPDKSHLHHRLLQIGHSHRRVVLLIYLWVGIVALGAAGTIFFDPRYTGAVMLAALAVAVVVTVIPLLRRDDDELTRLSDSLYDRR
jgi:UDP-N-acetylmuramyl pentapeptide phosphotransferase/UDP-N-acetylglucosamine-1-phosphate transferase